MTQEKSRLQDNVDVARQGFETYNRHWHPDEPDGVFVATRLHGKGAGSGAAVEQFFWYATEMDGGWERRIRVCGDPAEALEAVGVRR
jgi:hypothetical protein